MPLDRQVEEFFQRARIQFPTPSTPKTIQEFLTEQRAADTQAKSIVSRADEREPVASVQNLKIPGPGGEIPIRIYLPESTPPFPLLLFFHGGGVTGNLDTHDLMCRRFCREAACLVLAVDHRRPPEHPFPAAPEDCYAAVAWMASHAAEFQGDASRIAIGGDSGGGNLAAAVTLMCRDRGTPALIFQFLLWPLLDYRTNTASWRDYDGYLINSADFLPFFRDLYVPRVEDRTHPYAAPLFAQDLHGLPSTLIITAECDPLRDGAEEYGQCLQAAGIPTIVTRYNGMLHGFMHLEAAAPTQVRQAFAQVSRALLHAFEREQS